MLSQPRQSRPGPGRHAHDRARLSRQHRQSARQPDTTARPARRLRGQQGSGTAIGVAIIYPVLMAVIVALQAITDATRTEQSLQVAADRAAQTAALCCETIGHAAASAKESLAGALSARGVACVDGAGMRLSRDRLKDEIDVSFLDVYGNPRFDIDKITGDPNLYYYDSPRYPSYTYWTQDAAGFSHRRFSDSTTDPAGFPTTLRKSLRNEGLLLYDVNGKPSYVADASTQVMWPNDPSQSPGPGGHYAFDEDGNPIARPSARNSATTPVPRAGRAIVSVTCMLETGQLGRTVAGPDGVRRYAVGQSVVDPYRQRAPAPGP